MAGARLRCSNAPERSIPLPGGQLMKILRGISRLSLVGLAAVVPLGSGRPPAPATLSTEDALRLLASASSFDVTIEGTKQGKFKGGRTGDRIAGLAFHYDVKSPRDIATGMASGKRQHGAITFTKAVDSSSPQIFQALVGNEPLKSVLFEFRGTNANGEEMVVYQITLTNATISELEQYVGMQGLNTTAEAKHSSASDTSPMEDVSLTFQKIEVQSQVGKTMAADDWRAKQ
jgi:type VI secretion system secreted protein Hcp